MRVFWFVLVAIIVSGCPSMNCNYTLPSDSMVSETGVLKGEEVKPPF